MKRNNVLVATDIGSFIINKNDLGVGWQLTERGNYDPHELQILKGILGVLRQSRPNLIVLDVGANIGVHSVVLSQELGSAGKLFAFEAQPIIFNMLAGNIALNGIENVRCYNKAVSDFIGHIDVPRFDYGKPLSFGSVEFGGKQTESIGQEPIQDPDQRELVECISIDSLGLPHVDLLKVDVEGMELAVMRGAEELIAQCKPVIQAEYLKGDREGLKQWLKDRSYRVFIQAGNYLAIPVDSPVALGGLEEV